MMPAEGRENPLLKKGNSDAFFREKYLTKNRRISHQLPGILQQLGLLISKCFQYQFFLGGKKSVEKGLGDTNLFAQYINTAMDQPSVHDTLDHGGLQSFPYLFSLPLRIRFPCHTPSPPYIKHKIKK